MSRRSKNPPPISNVGRPETASLEDIFVFRRARNVTEFLEEHPYLCPLLFEAYDRIQEHFGPRPQVTLEVVTDPEATDDRMLYAFIATRLPPEEALEKLDQFDEEWWLTALARTQGMLCIDIEFV